MCVCVSAHLGPHLSQTLFSCCEGRGAPSQLPITLFKPAEGFRSSSVPACKRTCTRPPPLLNLPLRICSHVQQTAGELSQRSQLSEVALRARGRGVQTWAEPSQAPRNPPQHQDCSNILVSSREPPMCIHNPLLVSTRSQHGTRSALQY